MADILQEIAELNSRLQPHLTQYRELLISDPVYEVDVSQQFDLGLNKISQSEI